MFKESFFPAASREGIEREKKKIIAELEDKKKSSEGKPQPTGMSRRDFLKFGAGLAAAGVAGKAMSKLESIDRLINPENSHDGEGREERDDEIYYDGKEPDIQAIKEILDFEAPGRIKITQETSEKLKDYWEYTYANRMKPDLISALDSMRPYLPELRNIFSEEGVPEEYVLLAIPESHWKLNAVSRANAKGPYQFTFDTAVRYGLVKMDNKKRIIEDKRTDPLASGRACARLLRDLNKACKGDWDLALAGYNGGFIWKYLSECRSEAKDPNHADFLAYLSRRADEIKQGVKQLIFGTHTVAKKETLLSISKYHNIKLSVLKKYNNLKSNSIRIGQQLKFPLSNVQKSEKFQREVRGIAENLNYPPKFKAVIDLVERTTAWKEGGENKKV